MLNLIDRDRRKAHLISTEELAECLAQDDPQIRIVDMRGAVKLHDLAEGVQRADYLGAEEAYREEHIPGAVYLNWTTDLADENDPVPAQAAPPEKIAKILGGAGIGNDTLVVAYDDLPASQFATRLWWLLKYYGHNSVKVLEGGLKKWKAEGRTLTAENPSYPQEVFTPRLCPEWRLTAEEVLARLKEGGCTLVDARDEGQYSGRIRRGSRGGRIPGALSLPREKIFTQDGLFQPPDKLRRVMLDAGVKLGQPTIAYCNGGVAATTVLFALSMLGVEHLSNYDGSWNEWNERADLPVEA